MLGLSFFIKVNGRLELKLPFMLGFGFKLGLGLKLGPGVGSAQDVIWS